MRDGVCIKLGRIATCLMALAAAPPVGVEAGTLKVSWTAPVTNANGTPLTDLGGYRVYVGTSSPACPSSSFHSVSSATSTPAPNQTVSASITGLTAGSTYWLRVSAVDKSGAESACSTTASGVAKAILNVSPTGTVSFGSILTGATVDRTFTVQNATGSTLSGGASVASPFSIVSGGSFTLAAGASAAVVVRFRPTTAGTFATNLNVSAQGDTVARALSASATGSSLPTPPSSTPTLTVSRTGSGSGTVTSSPTGISCGTDCTQTYTAGTRVTLTASPASGSKFRGWSGGGCSGTGSCAVTLNASTTVTAIFDPLTSTSGSRPDLALTGVSVPSIVNRISAFAVGFNIVNQGTAVASDVQVKIYLSRDGTRSSDDIELRLRTFGLVAIGAILSNLISETIPTTVSPGSYYLLFVADAGGTVPETNEGNNIVARPVTVQ